MCLRDGRVRRVGQGRLRANAARARPRAGDRPSRAGEESVDDRALHYPGGRPWLSQSGRRGCEPRAGTAIWRARSAVASSSRVIFGLARRRA